MENWEWKRMRTKTYEISLVDSLISSLTCFLFLKKLLANKKNERRPENKETRERHTLKSFNWRIMCFKRNSSLKIINLSVFNSFLYTIPSNDWKQAKVSPFASCFGIWPTEFTFVASAPAHNKIATISGSWFSAAAIKKKA